MSRELPLGVQVRATIAAFIVPPLLRCVSFSRLASWLDRGAGRAADGRADDFDDAALARVVDTRLRGWRGLWRHTCLKRAAVLYYVLRRAGRPVELCIGVRRDATQPAGVGAHAWLVRDGAPYLEPSDHSWRQHSAIARFPDVREAR
jgi:hypothetical protein